MPHPNLSTGIRRLDHIPMGGLPCQRPYLVQTNPAVGKTTVALQFLFAGVIAQQHKARDYRAARRRLAIKKLRGLRFRDGLHDCAIRKGEIQGYSRLVAAESVQSRGGLVSNSIPELDSLLGVGLDRGPGKSTAALKFAVSAAARGEKTRLYVFDESVARLRVRVVAVIMVLSHQGIMGDEVRQMVDVSYRAGTAILFRTYEHAGVILKAVSVYKHRVGAHETATRELVMGPPEGVRIGRMLSMPRGVLTHSPVSHDAKVEEA